VKARFNIFFLPLYQLSWSVSNWIISLHTEAASRFLQKQDNIISSQNLILLFDVGLHHWLFQLRLFYRRVTTIFQIYSGSLARMPFKQLVRYLTSCLYCYHEQQLTLVINYRVDDRSSAVLWMQIRALLNNYNCINQHVIFSRPDALFKWT